MMIQEENLTQEEAIWRVVEGAYAKLDKTTSVESQLDAFLADIQLTASVENQFDVFLADIKREANVPLVKNLIKDCFTIACQLPYKHITNTHLVVKLDSLYPTIPKRHIRMIMCGTFKDWLINHPELHEAYPTMSFTILLKVFAKKLKQAEG